MDTTPLLTEPLGKIAPVWFDPIGAGVYRKYSGNLIRAGFHKVVAFAGYNLPFSFCHLSLTEQLKAGEVEILFVQRRSRTPRVTSLLRDAVVFT